MQVPHLLSSQSWAQSSAAVFGVSSFVTTSGGAGGGRAHMNRFLNCPFMFTCPGCLQRVQQWDMFSSRLVMLAELSRPRVRSSSVFIQFDFSFKATPRKEQRSPTFGDGATWGLYPSPQLSGRRHFGKVLLMPPLKWSRSRFFFCYNNYFYLGEMLIF